MKPFFPPVESSSAVLSAAGSAPVLMPAVAETVASLPAVTDGGAPGTGWEESPTASADFPRTGREVVLPGHASFSARATAGARSGDPLLPRSHHHQDTAGGMLIPGWTAAPATASLASGPLASAAPVSFPVSANVSMLPIAEPAAPFVEAPRSVAHAAGLPGGNPTIQRPPQPAANDTLTQAQINQLKDGINQTFSPIDTAVGAQVFAEKLPLLGTGLKDAFDSSGVTGALHDVSVIRDAINAGFNSLNGSATYTTSQVASTLDAALRAAGITSVGVNAVVNDAGEPRLGFTTGSTFAALSTPLASDFGLPGIGFQSSGNAQTVLRDTFNFSAGVDAGGFYLDTTPGITSLRFDLDTKLPGFSAGAHLGPLRFTATDLAANPTDFNAGFSVQLKDPNGDGKLRLGELAGSPDLLDATFSGNAAVNLRLASDLGTAVLPDIAADLNFNWNFLNAVVTPGASQVNFGGTPTVNFKNVSLGLGSFFSDFVSPVFGELQLITGPLQPIVDVLETEIKPLSDLAGTPVTILSIAGGIGALSPETAARIHLYDQLITFINSVPTVDGSLRIDLGDYNLGGADVRDAAFQLVNSIPTPIRNALAAGSQNSDLQQFLNDKSSLPGGGLSFPIIENPSTAINLLVGKPVDFFTYHVPGLDLGPAGFDEFYRLFGPLGVRLQGQVEAHAFLDVGYDSSGVTQFATTGDAGDILNGFYVVDQPGPEATLSGDIEAFLALNVIFAEAGVGGGLDANLDIGLNDNDFNPGDGRVHLAELNGSCLFSTSGELSAGLSAYLTVGFGPFSETFEKSFAHVTLLDFSGLGCDANGNMGQPALAHVLGASIALNVGPDAHLRGIGDVTDGAEDFAVVHVSGGADGETIGVRGGGLLAADGTPLAPQSYTAGGGNGRITADGGDKDDSLALAPDVLTPAALRGGAGNDRIIGGAGADTLNGDDGIDLILGGAGNDSLLGGNDPDFLDGQDDNDTLRGGGGADLLIGGPGADLLDGGAGYDTASYETGTIGIVLNLANPGSGTGDAAGDTYVSIERIVGTPFGDILLGDDNSNDFSGGAGDDVLDGKGGDDLLTGNAGADQLTGGAGNDFAAYTASPAGVNVSLLTGLGSGGDAQGDTLSGIENLQGSSDYGDTLEGDNGPNWLRGLAGANVLSGLGGNDSLEGGKDNDSLTGGDGNDTLRASGDPANIDPATNQAPLTGGLDTLRGGAGNDILYGDDGGDLLDGGGGDDQIFGAKDDDTISGGAGNDTISGGAGNDGIDAGEGQNVVHGDDGNDAITAGSGADQIFGDAGNDTISAGDGANIVSGGTGGDLITAGLGADTLHGDAGNDTITAGAGDDFLYGDDDNDSLDGGIGSDRVDGGAGNDILSVGNLRGATQDPDRLDHLFGGAGIDTISADFSNQTVPIAVVAGGTQSLVFADGAEARDFENVHDLATGSGADSVRLDGAADDRFGNLLRTGAGNDVIYSGSGNDSVDAGDDDDFVNGGFNDAVLTFDNFGTVTGFTAPGDTLLGGAGNDTLSFEGFFKPITAGFGTGNPLGVIINLGNNTAGGGATGTTFSGFENLIGTNFGDELTGSDGPNLIDPLRGGGNSSSGATGGPDRIDGGAGNDTLRIDFSRADLPNAQGVSTNRNFISRNDLGNTAQLDAYSYANIESLQITGASKNDVLYPDLGIIGDDTLSGLGGNDTLGGGGGNDLLLGGDGDDLLTGQGHFGQEYSGIAGGRDFFDGGAGNDLVEDIAFNGPNPTLAADARFQLDGGTGFDTLSADFSNQTAAIVWTSAAPANVDFADGAFFHNFETLRYFATGSGNDSLTQLGRVNNLFYLGAGNDTVNPGLGVDTVDGGDGTDTAILDFSVGDTPDLTGLIPNGNLLYYRQSTVDGSYPDVISIQNIEHLILTGTSKADNFPGTYGDDTLLGGDGNDTINALGGSDSIDGGLGDDLLYGSYGDQGSGRDDTLKGGAGNDTLYGRGGNDSLVGGQGDDQLFATDNFSSIFPRGTDVLSGGAGNDLIVDIAVNSGYAYSDATTRLLLDGGDGVDTLQADFYNESQPIVWTSVNPTNLEFADGAYARNFEVFQSLIATPGNDSITQLGRVDNYFSVGAGQDTVNPGLGIDLVYGGYDGDLLIVDYSAIDTPNLSGVTNDGTYARRTDTVTGAVVDSLYAPGFSRYQLTGASQSDLLIGSDGNDTITGNAGNDTLNGGFGADVMNGGAGNDLYYVDNAGDTVIEGIGGGTDTILTNLPSYTLGANLENATATPYASTDLTGNNADNVLAGSQGNNLLAGLKGNDTLLGDNSTLLGTGQRDTLTGGQGADVFVLGTTAGRLYDDGNANSDGTNDYALLTDFTPDGQSDRLQLNGSASQYFLGASPVNGVPGTGLFFDSNHNGAFDAGTDELLAILRSPATLTAANTLNNALFVTGG